ncbi:MAG TPA: hypothetical protein VEX18_22820 [Polyangiaceae bacterium]|nr:hypothetical protein [Polyangiaceae bacterium]
MNIRHLGFAMALGLSALGCGSDDDKDSAALEIIGEYDDNFGGEQIITTDEWNGAAIQDYDNQANVVYTQNSENDMFNPDKFSKFVYTDIEDDSFYFCQVLFDADTLADAQASDATADDSDPAETGCGGTFAWTLATQK